MECTGSPFKANCVWDETTGKCNVNNVPSDHHVITNQLNCTYDPKRESYILLWHIQHWHIIDDLCQSYSLCTDCLQSLSGCVWSTSEKICAPLSRGLANTTTNTSLCNEDREYQWWSSHCDDMCAAGCHQSTYQCFAAINRYKGKCGFLLKNNTAVFIPDYPEAITNSTLCPVAGGEHSLFILHHRVDRVTMWSI